MVGFTFFFYKGPIRGLRKWSLYLVSITQSNNSELLMDVHREFNGNPASPSPPQWQRIVRPWTRPLPTNHILMATIPTIVNTNPNSIKIKLLHVRAYRPIFLVLNRILTVKVRVPTCPELFFFLSAAFL